MNAKRKLESYYRRIELYIPLMGVFFSIFHLGLLYFSFSGIESDGFVFFKNVNSSVEGVALFIGLLMSLFTKWPHSLSKFKIGFWYMSILYLFPFWSTFMLLGNQDQTIAYAASLVLFATTAFITPVILLGPILLIGCFGGYLAQLILLENVVISSNMSIIAMAAMVVVGIALLFENKRQQIYAEHVQLLKSLGGSIAHELRTPLTAIVGLSHALKGIGENAAFHEKRISSSKTDFKGDFQKKLENIEDISQDSLFMIDLLLSNLKEETKFFNYKDKTVSANKVIVHALNSYPMSEDERKLVHFNDKEEFYFKGDELLFTYVIYNLLKNSLYQIKKAGKGEIRIWFDSKLENLISIYFEDTACGVDKKDLMSIFDRFYSKSRVSTGLGLSFCKNVIESFGGNITCLSEKGVYTRFIITMLKK